MHEVFEHTADLGLRVRAPDLDTLFREAAEALIEAIVEVGDPIGDDPGVESLTIDVPGQRLDWLLFDWLAEVLYVVDTRRMVLGHIAVRVGADGLRARAHGRTLSDHDRLQHEVKAITYHRLAVERTGDGWLAEVIVDI